MFRFITAIQVVAIAAVLSSSAVQAQRGGRGAVQLPDGAGRTLVEANCAACHALALIPQSAGYSREGWQSLFTSMITLPKDQSDTIATYLATHFPEKPGSRAVLIPGPAAINIREWPVPTLGSRPHDPLAARDGSIWWTGQYSHKIGRLDPKTGQMTPYPIQKAEPSARGPHTPIFDRNGMLWFTVQSGHVGRLNPATGEMKIVAAPSGAGNTYPYGIQINSQGVPWYVDFRGNRIASVDPQTMAIREITLPAPDARPRRIAIGPDDVVWYTDYARGYLGRYDPKTGAMQEFPSPGGRNSQPYGIATIGSVVWYSESGVHPNTLVRFDPATQKFQTWAIPSGGGVVRNMMRTADNNLVLACSGVNRVALVEIKK